MISTEIGKKLSNVDGIYFFFFFFFLRYFFLGFLGGKRVVVCPDDPNKRSVHFKPSNIQQGPVYNQLICRIYRHFYFSKTKSDIFSGFFLEIRAKLCRIQEDTVLFHFIFFIVHACCATFFLSVVKIKFSVAICALKRHVITLLRLANEPSVMDVYNQFVRSKLNETILNQLTATANFRSDSTQSPIDSATCENDTSVNTEKSKTATMSDTINISYEQHMNQLKNEHTLGNSILHEINRQFFSALLQKGVAKSSTEFIKSQNVSLNPLTPPQTPITIATSVPTTTATATNTSFGGDLHADAIADNGSHRKRKRPPTACDIDANDGDTESPPLLTMINRMSDSLNRSDKSGPSYCGDIDSMKKRRRNDDIRTDEMDPDPEREHDSDGDGEDGDGNGDDRFDRSDISSDTERDDKSNFSDGHDSSHLSKVGMGFGENETSFDSVSTIPAANSMLFSGGSKVSTGTGLNLAANKDKLNLLKLISLQGDENKLIGE